MIRPAPRIATIEPKRLIGMHITMTLTDDATSTLWRTFIPRRREIADRATTDSISMRVYPVHDATMFAPSTTIEKWAAVEVTADAAVPDGMDSCTLEGGQYAVFNHQGSADTAPEIMGYIYGEWLPTSGYRLDARAHFEVLPEGYDPFAADAREEIWIPIEASG